MNIELFKLYRIDYLNEYKKYFCFFDEIKDPNIDIMQVLPDNKLDDFIENIKSCKETVQKYDRINKYSANLKKYNSLFKALKSAKIDVLAYKAFCEIESNESILSSIKSFKPYKQYAKSVEYDKLNNVSGRLVVKKGPKILTLPSRHRSIIKSRFEKGSIYSIDFSSLEPRITAKLSETVSGDDIYKDILELLSYDADRSVIKKAVISSIYGANYTSLENLSVDKSKELFDVINNYFDFKKILKMSSNIDDFGIRRNYFGRPIWNLKENRENILINNYIQSTAVDISLLYFSNLVDVTNNIVPLFVLHDALIVDIDDKNFNDIKKIVEKGYVNDKLGHFPLKIEKFNI
tara:strand:+ start:942 stop:1985 length:1044 start_codon:yes stop_codon:yes gene_type:complete